LEFWITRGQLDRSAEKLVATCLEMLNLHQNQEARDTRENIQQNRFFKQEIEKLETHLNTLNISLVKSIAQLKAQDIPLPTDTLEYMNILIDFDESTENSYRIEQVHEKIELAVFKALDQKDEQD
jgi:hypothetical protein